MSSVGADFGDPEAKEVSAPPTALTRHTDERNTKEARFTSEAPLLEHGRLIVASDGDTGAPDNE